MEKHNMIGFGWCLAFLIAVLIAAILGILAAKS